MSKRGIFASAILHRRKNSACCLAATAFCANCGCRPNVLDRLFAKRRFEIHTQCRCAGLALPLAGADDDDISAG